MLLKKTTGPWTHIYARGRQWVKITQIHFSKCSRNLSRNSYRNSRNSYRNLSRNSYRNISRNSYRNLSRNSSRNISRNNYRNISSTDISNTTPSISLWKSQNACQAKRPFQDSLEKCHIWFSASICMIATIMPVFEPGLDAFWREVWSSPPPGEWISAHKSSALGVQIYHWV